MFMKIQNKDKIEDIFYQELFQYRKLLISEMKWVQLERLHIIGQFILRLHFQAHFLMLHLAFKERKFVEINGQILRIILVMPGHIFGLLPLGNIGTSRVSPFQKMEIPDDIFVLFNAETKKD